MRNCQDKHLEGIEKYPVRIFTGTSWKIAAVDVVREVHLKVYLNGQMMITIACAGINMEELAVGWLRGEGIIRTAREIEALEVSRDGLSINVHTRAAKHIKCHAGPDPASSPIPDSRFRRNDNFDTYCCQRSIARPGLTELVDKGGSLPTGQGVLAAAVDEPFAAGQPVPLSSEKGGGTIISSSGARSAALAINGSDSETGLSGTPSICSGMGMIAGEGAGQNVAAMKPLTIGTETISPARIFMLMEGLVAAAGIHNLSRGTHGAALADKSAIFVTREDIGRHNCLDMLSGYALLHEIECADKVLLRTGRVSSEIVHKIWRLGVPVVLSLSVPTALAISLAGQAGITLVGAIRAPSLTVYTHTKRIIES